MAALVLVPPAAWAQLGEGYLPVAAGGGGGVRARAEQFLPHQSSVNTGLAFDYGGSLGLQLGYTDNAAGNTHQSDFFTLISPSLYISGQSRRLSLNLSYSPEIILYANTAGQSRVSQNLNVSATATLVPDAVFLDVRAFTSDQSRFGSNQTLANQASVVYLNKNSAVQTGSYSVSPYAVQRFGGWGTARVGYVYSSSFQGSGSGFATNPLPATAVLNTAGSINGIQGYGTAGSLGSNQEFASFVSGENLGRINEALTITANQYGGSSYNNSLANSLSFALSRTVTVFGNVGYDDLRYGGGTNRYRLGSASWAVGTRLTPNADSSLSLQYGRRQGDTTVSFNGFYALTPRITLSGSYSTDVTTSLQQQQTLLQSTSVGPNGILVDSRTGLPVNSGSILGIQNNLSRVKQLTVSAAYVLDRDSFIASVSNVESTTLLQGTNAIGNSIPAGTKASSTAGSLSWQHDLNATTSLSTGVSYGISNNGGLLGVGNNASQNTFTATAALGHTFTQSVTGNLSYSYNQQTGAVGNSLASFNGSNGSQSVLLLGLRKSF
ncbi:MAG: hypothetical protein NVSMB18_06220 [Acetobacteraceae bacterium]